MSMRTLCLAVLAQWQWIWGSGGDVEGVGGCRGRGRNDVNVVLMYEFSKTKIIRIRE